MRDRINNLPRRLKSLILAAFDACALIAILWLSFQFRLGTTFQPTPVPVGADRFSRRVVALPIFLRLGLYRSVIRYLPDRAVWTILQAMALATLTWVFLLFVAEATRFAVDAALDPAVLLPARHRGDRRLALRGKVPAVGAGPRETARQDHDADLRRRRRRHAAGDGAADPGGGVRRRLPR